MRIDFELSQRSFFSTLAKIAASIATTPWMPKPIAAFINRYRPSTLEENEFNEITSLLMEQLNAHDEYEKRTKSSTTIIRPLDAGKLT